MSRSLWKYLLCMVLLFGIVPLTSGCDEDGFDDLSELFDDLEDDLDDSDDLEEVGEAFDDFFDELDD
jgi:hypothetical protein